MLNFWKEHWRKNVAQINLSTKLNIAGGWCYRQLANRAERSLWPLQNDAHVPNFEQPKCFTNVHPQRLGHDKMQYLETAADAASEILKDKFQYVSDQLEMNSKQHQAVKGRFVSYLQEHVVVGFNSSC